MPWSNQSERAPTIHRNHHFHHPIGALQLGRHPKEDDLEQQYDDGERWETNVREVWFAGCHCDVGGGSVKNGTRHSLARIPLRWMIRQTFLAGTGIQFHRSLLPTIGMDPAHLYPFVLERKPAVHPTPQLVEEANTRAKVDAKTKRHDDGTLVKKSEQDHRKASKRPHKAHRTRTQEGTGDSLRDVINADYGPIHMDMPEEEEDIRDALSPIFDELVLSRGWWVLEAIPLTQNVQNEDKTYVKKFM
jgi:hypothetical protein